jgi:hypothetical protein
MPERHGTGAFETFSTQRRSDTAETILLKRRHAADTRQLKRHDGGRFGGSGAPTGTLPARLEPKNAFREGLVEAGNDRFHRRINELDRFNRPAHDRHAAPEGRNHAG